jgi:translation initiation factor 1
MRDRSSDSGVVYSTEFGKMCPGCSKTKEKCTCRPRETISPNDGIVRLKRETKGRKGRGVTLITGLPLTGNDLKKLAKSLKQKCGCGGSIKLGIIEIQGDHRDILEGELKSQGYVVKRAGG